MTEASSDVLAAATDRARRSLADLERLDMTELSRLSLSLRDVDDRVAITLAAEDAVIAAVAAPFVSEEVRETLATHMDRLRPPWEIGGPGPAEVAERHAKVTRWSTYVAFVALVVGSAILLALGSSVGLFGLAAAIGIALVALVIRGRPEP